MEPREMRRSPRAKHDSVVEIFDAEGHLIIGIGRMINFSNVGICFSSTQVLKKGQRLHARIRLLREGALETSAHIVWVKKRPAFMLYGIAFDTIQKIQTSVI